MNVHAAAIGILQNTEAKVRTDLLAATTAQTNYANAQTAKIGLTTTQTIADSNAKAFIGITRDVLAVTLGGQWSQVWEATGFPNNSLAIPAKMGDRQALLASLQAYLTANPTKENAPLGVTATLAGTRFTALSDARSAVNAGLVESGQKKALRDTGDKNLRKRLRGTIDELGQLLADDDPRWLAFGLIPPAESDQPDAPADLVLTAGGPGEVLADWSDAARAVSYRVYQQVVGTDPDFVLAVSVFDSDATLSGLPSAATVKVRVIAINADGDESPPSETQQIVVP
ncbi:MAG: fibronectin type III domain-containing protein [Planctomycetaceae bacterium]|nr:fibronectin type III domain-containing protein [Planctomycetaceae bacterium]